MEAVETDTNVTPLTHKCPMCGNRITRAEFLELEKKIRAEEEARLQQRLKDERAELAAQREAIEQRAEQAIATKTKELDDLKAARMKEAEAHQAEVQKIRTDADTLVQAKENDLAARIEEESTKRSATLSARIDMLNGQLKSSEERSAEQIEQRDKELAKIRDERNEEQKNHTEQLESLRFEANEKLKAKEQELATRVEVEATKRSQQLSAERDAMATQLKEASARETALRQESERQISLKVAETEACLRKEMLEQRELLEKDRDEKIQAKEIEVTRVLEKQQEKLDDMKRQLARKTSDELGALAEINLLEELQDHFVDDDIVQVPKQHGGADVIQDVVYKGEVCGRIVHDSKSRKIWKNEYAFKLMDDKKKHEADYAVLETIKFPSGEKGLHIHESGAVLVNPSHAVSITALLRSSLIQMHQHGLSETERETKMEELYDYLTSETFRRLMEEAENALNDLDKLREKEIRYHNNTWKSQGRLERRVQKALSELSANVSTIVEGESLV